MPVYKIKDYKIVNGNRVKKNKKEYNRETCGGKKTWYFKCQYKDLLGDTKSKKSKKYASRDEALLEERKFLTNCNNISVDSSFTIYDLYNVYFFEDKNVINKDSSLYTKESRIRKYILPFFVLKGGNYIKLSLVNNEKCQQWKLWLNNFGLSLRTRKSIFNTFSSIFTYAVEKGYVEYNPLKLCGNFKEKQDKIEENEEIRFLTKEEYNLFLNEMESEFKVVFHFLYETGCRKGEMQALNWTDINFEKEQIRINKTLSNKNLGGGIKITNTKNKKIRYIDISVNLKKELLELYKKMSSLDGFSSNWYVFGGIKHLSSSTLKRKKDECFERLAKKEIKITNITIHEFRHSSASYMISNGISDSIIAYRLGDSVDTIRKVYAHLFPDTQKETKLLFNDL